MTPEVRCTIFHDTFAPEGKVVEEPLGLKDARLKLEREPNLSSLVETFEGDFIWYGSARSLLREIEDAEGPDAQVRIHFDIKYKKVFEKLFYGMFNMEELQDIDNEGGKPYKCTVPIMRDDLWARFINQRTKPVNLQSPTDVDGELRTVLTPTTLNLPSQKVRQKFLGGSADNTPETYLITYDIPAGEAANLDIFTELELNEIAEKIEAGTDIGVPPVQPMFKLKFGGNYRFNMKLFVWGAAFTYQVDPDVNAWIQFNEGAPVALTRTDIGTDFVDGVTTFELIDYDFNTTVSGVIVRIFLRNDNGFALNKPAKIPNWHIVPTTQSTLSIVADTIYPDSTAPSFKVHEAFQSILDRILSRDKSFYSEYLGNPGTQDVDYAEFGCGSAYAIAKGLHIRGYGLTAKPFALSFDNMWNGLHPCLNLGLGYSTIVGPVWVQFLKNTGILHFDSPDNTDWFSSGNPAYGAWTEGGDGWVGTTVNIFEIHSQDLTQSFVPKPANTDYKVSWNIILGAGQVARLILDTYLAGVFQENVYDDNYVGVSALGDPLDILFTSTLKFDQFKFRIECVDPSPHPTTIELSLKLFACYQKMFNVPVIRVEQRRFFYNLEPSLLLNNCKLVRTYDSNEITKGVKIGYAKSLVGSESGIDDPQTSRTYGTKFKTLGKDQVVTSTFIGASLAWEQTRRQARLEAGKDWQLDEDVFILALNKESLNTPELDENFPTILNLLNKETRYNIRLSVARNMQRWLNVFSGCLQWYAGAKKLFNFITGTGNFDMQTVMDGADCEGVADIYLNEYGDFVAVDDFLTKPVAYEYDKCPLPWEDYKTIRDNAEHGIGMSRSEENHKINFIKKLDYAFMDTEAKINTLLGEADPIEE